MTLTTEQPRPLIVCRKEVQQNLLEQEVVPTTQDVTVLVTDGRLSLTYDLSSVHSCSSAQGCNVIKSVLID